MPNPFGDEPVQSRQVRTNPFGDAPASGSQAAEDQGFLGRTADFITSIPGRVSEAFQGPEGLEELPEFDAPAPSIGKTIKAAGGLMATSDPQAQKDIIEENYPGAEIETVGGEEGAYHIVDWTDPQGERHRGYINAPGLSFRDLTSTAGQILAFTPSARAGRGLGVVRRALTRTGPGAAATSAGLDVVSGQAGSEQGIDPARAGIEGAIGVGAELLSPAAGAVWRQIRGRGRYFNNRTGNLTREGRRVAEEAGLSGEDIADLNQQAQRTLGEFTEAGVDPEVGARAARVAEFDIPATRGQVGRAGQQVGAEERMRAGAMGEIPQSQMQRFGERQQAAVEGAAEGVQRRIGRTTDPALREAEAAETVMSGTRAAANDLRRRIDEAYEAVRGEEMAISPQAAYDLPERVAENLDEFNLTQDLTPAALSSTQIVGELAESVAEGNGSRFEVFRRRLNNQIGAAKNPTDRKAATRVKNAFDQWIDDAMDQGLMEGRPEALDMLKNARSLRTQYGRQFQASDKTDTAGKIMQNIVEDAETPEQVVNYIFGQSALGRKQATTTAIRRLRDAVGEDSPAWDSLRENAWLRLTRDRRGEMFSGRVLKNNIKELKSRNKSLYDELFDKEEQRLINRFAEAVDVTQPPTQNPSGTAASLENAIRYTLRRFGQRESFTKGNVGKGTVLNFMARMRLPVIGRGLGGSPAERAQNIRPPSPQAPGFVSSALGVGGTQGEGNQEEAQ